MNREELVAALRLVPFDTHGIQLELGFMDAVLTPIPKEFNPIEGGTMHAVTRYAGPTLEHESMLENAKAEIQQDLDILALDIKEGKRVERFGVFYNEVPVHDTNNLIRYAKIASVKCNTSIGCSHVMVVGTVSK